jgi:putative pyruvate formate lyase activating enzyme
VPQPAYTHLTDADWERRIAALEQIAARCALCPRRCGIDRHAGETGFCGAPAGCVISSIFPHHGEEPPLSGTGGSGTVFFTHCTLKCLFCQNYQISHEGEGRLFSEAELAQKLLRLQAQGCHNANLVTATHQLPWILPALRRAAGEGLRLPVVYNCGGYELPETIDLLKDVVDIWLPDMKYGENTPARRYSAAPDYVEVNRTAIRQMFRQVGPLRVDENGIAERGLLIRHLVLPHGESASPALLDFLKRTFDPQDITVSLMAQYRPLYRACGHPPIAAPLTPAAYEPVKAAFLEAGFGGFFQEIEKLDTAFVIDFTQRKEEPLTGA